MACEEDLEEQIFEIISSVGTAKSCFIEAIAEAKKGDFAKARALIEEGNKSFINGHRVHHTLLEKEMGGNPITISLIVLHAEDQIMAADSFKTIASSFIDLYEELKKKN
ncbi:MAG: PTS lactose/cellobiose transporter subunit IIA [Spirochaetaceae bacterium]|jgi:PTS system cellobiose-specific IIA component|nr:PTS lactose/cellobiose transporter subunit IIA [Spirochaetaceae bacterium]